MRIYSTKQTREVSVSDFSNLIQDQEIIASPHALWHLSHKQRKVFNVNELTWMILKETPRKVYLQENERYAAYYRKSDGYRKLIIQIRNGRAIVVTFMDISEIPRHKI